MDQPGIHKGPSVIHDEAVYAKLRKETEERDIDHVMFAEESWRRLLYGIARKDQDDPEAFRMAEHDIAELKAQGALRGTGAQKRGRRQQRH